MNPIYFDASALVKYYVQEPGSSWVKGMIDELDLETGERSRQTLIAEVSLVEVPAAFALAYRIGRISLGTRDGVFRLFLEHQGEQYSAVDVTSVDFRQAANLTQRHPLKAYDAMQLAVALRQQRILSEFDLSLTFVSGDRALLQAAEAEGLATDDPFDHVVPEDTPGR